MKKIKILLTVLILLLPIGLNLYAQASDRTRIPIPKINLDIQEAQTPQEISLSLQILFLLSILTLAPSIILLVTSFLRIAIVLDFVKRALSLQQMPPNQVIFGLAMFMTLFIMWPTIERMNNEAFTPFFNSQTVPIEQRITSTEVFFEKSMVPLREFMFKQTDPKYIGFFMNMRKLPPPGTYDDVPSYILIPAFVINEMTVGFKMGVLIFIPFMVLDMIIASILMAMGMMMLPPVMISLPFKLILFILVDGWSLLSYNIFRSFN